MRGAYSFTGLVLALSLLAPSIFGANVEVGTRVALTATADGSRPFSYQWLKNSAAINGATTDTLTLASVQLADAGSYAVAISNSAGSTTSAAVVLEVSAGNSPTITLQPAAQTIAVGHVARFVAGSSANAGAWQISTDGGASWRNLTDDGTYNGTNTGTLTISGVTSSMNGYKYRYTATGSSGTSSSSAVVLTVINALLSQPTGLAMNPSGALVVVDSTLNTVNTVTTGGALTRLAGAAGAAGTGDGSGGSAQFNQPRGVAVDGAGNLYVADSANATIRKITPAGTVSTFAGSAAVRGSADGTSATFSNPTGVAIDGAGNLYITDATNHTLRKISPAGTVSTLAGGAGATGSADGAGTSARFNHPTGVAVDRSGNIFVSDTSNNTIRLVTASGTVTTFAGLYGVSGSADGTGTSARFNQPAGLAIDASGNLYVADTGNSAIRKVTAAGNVSTFAGLPTIAGLLDGAGLDAWFNQPGALTVDGSGNIWVADTGNATLRKISPSGVVSTLNLAGETVASSPATSPSTSASPAPVTAPASSGGGGGGGGGAPSWWFLGTIAVLVWLRLKYGGTGAPRRLVPARSAGTTSE